MLLSVGFGFLRPRLDAGESSGGLSSPKPEPPNPMEVIYKSSEIELKSEEIQQVLNHIWWDLARSGHSQQISAILRRGSAILMQIRWVFTFSGDDFADSSTFFQMLVTFKTPMTTWNRPTNPISTRAQNRTNRLTPTVGFGSSFFPPDDRQVRFELGRKPTQPDPWIALLTSHEIVTPTTTNAPPCSQIHFYIWV